MQKIRLQLLLVMFFGGILFTAGANLRTNQLMIGDTVVNGTVSNGVIVGDRWIVVSNTLFQIHSEVTPLEESKTNVSSQEKAKPVLHLMLATGDVPMKPGNVKGLDGFICMAGGLRTPKLSPKILVNILATDDKTKIVLMVCNNGPIYSSTNSGMTWTVINTPGEYKFPLTSEPDGCGFFAQATIHNSPENSTSKNLKASNWYAVGSAPDGSKLVLTRDSSQPAPVLSIRHSGNEMILSWSSTFSNFILQQNDDLTTTNWVDVTNSVNVVGEENQVIVSPVVDNNFYRLKSQSP